MANPQANASFEDEQSKIAQYFSSLPAMAQETIKQCGVTFSSQEELKNYADNLLSRH